jgi:hypothetical protein
MRYLFATLVAIVVVGAMFAFYFYMSEQIHFWEETEKELSRAEIVLVLATEQFGKYWYLLAPLVVAVCNAVAALLPRREEF